MDRKCANVEQSDAQQCARVCGGVQRRARRAKFFRAPIWRALRGHPLLRVHSRPIARKRPPAAAALGLRVLCGEFYLLPLLRARARRQFCATPRAPRAAHPTPRAQTAAAPIATAQELPRARWPGNSICQVCARYSRGARATLRALCSRLSTNVLKRPARAPLPRAGSSTHEARWFPRAGLLAELAQGVFLLFARRRRARARRVAPPRGTLLRAGQRSETANETPDACAELA